MHQIIRKSSILFGDLALRAKHYTFAELAYSRALFKAKKLVSDESRKKKVQIRIWAGLASVEEMRQNHSQAINYLNQWLDVDPTSPVAHGSLGRVLFKSGDFKQARDAFSRLKSNAPAAPPVEIAMGRLYTDHGKDDLALAEMEKASANYSSDPKVLLTVVEWALDQGRYSLAESELSKSIKLAPNSLPAKLLAARMLRYKGKYDEAESALSQLLPLWPKEAVLIDEFGSYIVRVRRRTKKIGGFATRGK